MWILLSEEERSRLLNRKRVKEIREEVIEVMGLKNEETWKNCKRKSGCQRNKSKIQSIYKLLNVWFEMICRRK